MTVWSAGDRCGVRIVVSGRVQGVGFRPFAHRLAVELGVEGTVRNAGGSVVITAAGSADVLDKLVILLRQQAPRLARVDRVDVTDLPAAPDTVGFHVVASTAGPADAISTPPDLATCAACVRELFDPADRRYRYPFITCTDCGPRATIIDSLPYDRQRTTMRDFPLCPNCAAEYHDPANRRFHAEPIACPVCGPQLRWYPSGLVGEDALAAAVSVIDGGGIVAVKGIGGYQLVCDATDETAVTRLRAAKHRPAKPFAVMAPDLAVVAQLCTVDKMAGRLLRSPAAPIVLLPRRPETRLAGSVAPDLAEIGVFLPYSPLHHLLLAALAGPLVVTSGNRADEPIAVDDTVARATLGPITDGILGHDRPIQARHDDSVVRVLCGRPSSVRRARGYAPDPLPLPYPTTEPILALGAQLKHTAALAVGDRVVLGPHTGDLADTATFDAFTEGVRRLAALHDVEPSVCAHDPHPAYLSTRYAQRWPADRRVAVQHHHAHVAATAAEHGVRGRFLGIAYDGLGFGDDGTFWGGEILLATYAGYQRVARIATAPLPGGAAAVRRPARMALGYLFGVEDCGGTPIPDSLCIPLLERMDEREVSVVRAMIAGGVNCPRASSVGRLFDAVAALLGLCENNSYEGEAAIRLEAAATGQPHGEPFAWRLCRRGELWVYDPTPTLVGVLTAMTSSPAAQVAARFHTTVAEATVALAEQAAAPTGAHTVCLGGGVFANRRLTTQVVDGLADIGFEVHVGEKVPMGDGGISYGQAVVAAARLAGR